MSWQQISTAPTDGTVVRVRDENANWSGYAGFGPPNSGGLPTWLVLTKHPHDGFFRKKRTDHGWDVPCHPTHWQPVK